MSEDQRGIPRKEGGGQLNNPHLGTRKHFLRDVVFELCFEERVRFG